MQARRLPKLKAWMKQECCSPRVRTPHTVRLLLAYVPIGCLYIRDLYDYSASRYVNMYVYAVHVARSPFFVLRCNYLVRFRDIYEQIRWKYTCIDDEHMQQNFFSFLFFLYFLYELLGRIRRYYYYHFTLHYYTILIYTSSKIIYRIFHRCVYIYI